MPPESVEDPHVNSADEIARLDAALKDVPRGAVALAGTAVVLLILCWLAIYIFVFLARGSVG